MYSYYHASFEGYDEILIQQKRPYGSDVVCIVQDLAIYAIMIAITNPTAVITLQIISIVLHIDEQPMHDYMKQWLFSIIHMSV